MDFTPTLQQGMVHYQMPQVVDEGTFRSWGEHVCLQCVKWNNLEKPSAFLQALLRQSNPSWWESTNKCATVSDLLIGLDRPLYVHVRPGAAPWLLLC